MSRRAALEGSGEPGGRVRAFIERRRTPKRGDGARDRPYCPADAIHRIEEALVKKLCGLAAALFVAEAGNALAQEQQSFKTIMGKGYEIKNVTFARGEATEN